MKKLILATVALTALISIASTSAMAENTAKGMEIIGNKAATGPTTATATASEATSSVQSPATTATLNTLYANQATLQDTQTVSVFQTFKNRISDVYSGIVGYFSAN